MAEYTISFINNSTDTRSFLCYQKDPDIGVPNAVSLAWFAKTTRPNTHVDFSWKINYSFIWSETGLLKPGVRFVASERVDADLLNENDFSRLRLRKDSHHTVRHMHIDKLPAIALGNPEETTLKQDFCFHPSVIARPGLKLQWNFPR